MLTVQYRMHPEIRIFPSEHFYQNKLVDAINIAIEVALYKKSNILPPKSVVLINFSKVQNCKPVTFFDVGGQEKCLGKSYLNDTEVSIVWKLLQSFRSCFEGLSLAIICPYKAQVQAFRQKKRTFQNDLYYSSVEINTVDG